MKKIIALLTLLCLILIGCNSQKSTTTETSKTITKNKEYNPNTVEVTQPEIPLSVYLSKISGVTVRGTGANTQVVIRGGSNSFFADTEPLFLIDGVEIMGGFKAVNLSVTVNDIESITVYKNAAETSMYGVRGANGVIAIKLKTRN